MLYTTVLSLCAVVAIAAPMPSPKGAAPFIDINASNNKLDFGFPINVLGLQNHDVSALNGNLSPNLPPKTSNAPKAQGQSAQGVPNLLLGAVNGITSALYALAGAITGAATGRAQ